MKILAFLQNMWFKEPERAREVFAHHPDRRNDLIRLYLFMGCLTGRRLEQVFGEELCNDIIWEECSPEIGGQSNSAFPADPDHIRASIQKHSPDIILAFGKIALEGLKASGTAIAIIDGPHPAARVGAIEGLRQMHESLKSLIDCYENIWGPTEGATCA